VVEAIPNGIPLLKISDVTAATGIPCANLRAWERRYGFPIVVRTAGGQRLYSVEQVDELRRLQELIGRGLAVGQAVEVVRGPDPLACAGDVGDEIRGAFYDALIAMRPTEAEAVIAQATANCPLCVIIDCLIAPVMNRIGDDWYADAIGIEQEHFASAWTREWLGRQAQRLPAPKRDRLLLACVEGEWHDLGLMALQIELRREQFETLHLGANVPTEALVAAVRRYRPRLVLLSASVVEQVPMIRCVAEAIEEIPVERRPRIAYGGFATCGSEDITGADWLGATVGEAVSEVLRMLV
jgi:MerR family transcriptional regulator, light-induced transcriptional regulator